MTRKLVSYLDDFQTPQRIDLGGDSTEFLDGTGAMTVPVGGSGIPATIVDAKGDLIAATAADTVARVAVGSNGTYLKADSGASTGVSWDTPSGTGAVATDAIWDAAGDLAVGSGADTAARLAKGADGTALTMVSGAVAWKVLPVVANAIVATSQGHSGNNSWVDLATAGPAVTLTVPASGVVKVTVCGHAYNGTAGGYGGMGFALSGANTVAATGTKCLQFGTTAQTFDMRAAATFLLTGLTAGSTTFTAKYNQFGGPGTTTWTDREIIVETVP